MGPYRSATAYLNQPNSSLEPKVEVTFDRLTGSRRGGSEGGSYNVVENILLNMFANYTQLQKALTMQEGDSVALNLPAVQLEASRFERLVVIGHVEQPPFDPRDSSFDSIHRPRDPPAVVRSTLGRRGARPAPPRPSPFRRWDHGFEDGEAPFAAQQVHGVDQPGRFALKDPCYNAGTLSGVG